MIAASRVWLHLNDEGSARRHHLHLQWQENTGTWTELRHNQNLAWLQIGDVGDRS